MILSKLSPDFCAKIDLPASKSLSNRWLVLSTCMDSNIRLHNLSNAADTVLMQELLDKILQSKKSTEPVEINCENAGSVLRFLTACLSVTPGKWILKGDERLSVRPISDLVDALKKMGAEISYKNQLKQLPILITGKSKFSQSYVKLNMQKSSQFASALMLMISKFSNGLTIDFEGEVISKPYLEMTAKILEQCGVEVNRSEKSIALKGIPKCPSEIFIESDWTAASYFYAFVALSENGIIEIENLHLQSLQGDSIVAKWFEKLGVETTFAPTKITLKKVSKPLLSELELDFIDYPDLAQTVAVVCAALNIPARLTGLSSLRDKETDRLLALSQELNQIGAKNIIEQSTLILYKHDKLDFSKPIKTYGDHRMAMAFAIFSGLYDSVEIISSEVVNKSFPNFWKQIDKLKAVNSRN
ncbi:MAG: 3-phosphoshikimate 1-carboxyvinyltransferase [Bacteroidales bacterium]|nr:3-phosphoshikimate 1-carboxyvinyltransferase [Bacteroidales bacterium]